MTRRGTPSRLRTHRHKAGGLGGRITFVLALVLATASVRGDVFLIEHGGLPGVDFPMVGRREARLFRTAGDLYAAGRPAEAIVYDQALLDGDADGFLPDDEPDPTSKPTGLVPVGPLSTDAADHRPPARRGLRAAVTARLLGLTGEARDAYRQRYGPAAEGRLREAVAAGDRDAVAAVARRFPATEAGFEAALREAATRFDRGEPLAAVVTLERLRGHVTGDRKRLLLARLAAGYAVVGDAARRDAILADLPDSDALRTALASIRPDRPTTEGWPVAGGDPGRTNSRPAPSGPGRSWTATALPDPWTTPDAAEPSASEAAWNEAVKRLTVARAASSETTAGACRPVAAGGLIVHRTPAGLVALDAATGRTRWRSLADPLLWDDLTQFGQAAGDPPAIGPPIVQPTNNQPLEPAPAAGDAAFAAVFPQRLWDDATWGTLASDGRQVVAVEETGAARPLPPRRRGESVTMPSEWNRLVGYDLVDGRRRWEAGGPANEAGLLAGTFFLGPPTPVSGRWYVLGERDGVTRLIAFDPDRTSDDAVWSLAAAEGGLGIGRDYARRQAGLSPCLVGGLLVCPVGPGAVVAVDPGGRSLLWAFRQVPRVPAPPPLPPGLNAPGRPALLGPPARQLGFPRNGGLWRTDLVAAGGAVVIASRATAAVTALDPSDGRVLWEATVPDLLWPLAATDETLFLTTEAGVTAVRLADGSELWRSTTGEPSGRGLLVGERLIVPTASRELVLLDAATGRETVRVPAPLDAPAGNLILAGRTLVSQSPRRVIALQTPE